MTDLLPDPSILLQLLLFGLSTGAIITMMALGLTLLFGTVRILNLAYGDVYALSSVMVTVIVTKLNLQADSPPGTLFGGLLLALVGGIGLGALLNVLIERLAFRPFRGASRLAPLIATLGLSFIFYQVSLLWRIVLPSYIQGEHRSVPGLPEVPLDSIPDLFPNTDLFSALGIKTTLTLDVKSVVMFGLAVALALGLSLFLRRTRTGKALRAVAQNAELAQLCGINVNRMTTLVFALSGALAGAAAFFFAIYAARPFGQHGVQSGLIAFSAAILGGVGSPIGALVSGMGLGIATLYSDFFISAEWTPVIVYITLIVLLVIRPGGLAGDDHTEDTGTSLARDSVTVLYRGNTRRWVRWLWWAALAVAVLYPLADMQFHWFRQGIFTIVMIFIMLALGLTVLLGYAGLLDLGYAISFCIGGYAAALIIDPYSHLRILLGFTAPVDFMFVMLAAGMAAALFGVFNAALIFRMRSDYLAVVTLTYGLIIRQIILNLPDWTGGTGGRPALPPPILFTHRFNSETERYYLVLVIMLLVAIAVYRLIQSRTGRAFIAMGEDELAAASFGIHVTHYKSLAFILSTAIAGVAGALYASSTTYVDPDMGDFRVSMMILAMVIISGAGSVPGAIVGAIIISLYDRLMIPWLGSALAQATNNTFDIRQLSYLTFGLAVYLTVLLRARVGRVKVSQPST